MSHPKKPLFTPPKTMSFSEFLNTNHTFLFQLRYWMTPSAEIEKPMESVYVIEVLSKESKQPIFINNKIQPLASDSGLNLSDTLQALGTPLVIQASTPEQAFLELSRELSRHSLFSYRQKTWDNQLTSLSLLPLSLHQLTLTFDVTREWCYEQFGQSVPELSEVVTQPPVRVKRHQP